MSVLELWFSQSICPVVGLLGHKVVFIAVLISAIQQSIQLP